MADKIYDALKNNMATGAYNWGSDAATTLLLVDSSSTYVPSDAHNYLSDFTGNGGVEMSTTNYARVVLAGKTITRDDTTLHGLKFTANNVSWTNLGTTGKTIKAILIFKDTGTATTSPLIAYLDSGGNLALNGGNVTIQWGANGVFTLV